MVRNCAILESDKYRVLEQKNVNEVDDHTLILADVARKAVSQVRNTVREILSHQAHIESARAEELADLLATGTWTHDYPISVEEAHGLGLHVSTDMPEEVYKLMALYRQPAQKRPSVSYVPTPYRPPERRGTQS